MLQDKLTDNWTVGYCQTQVIEQLERTFSSRNWHLEAELTESDSTKS